MCGTGCSSLTSGAIAVMLMPPMRLCLASCGKIQLQATCWQTGVRTFAGLMDCHRSVSMDCVLLRKPCRISAGQLAGMWASKLAQSLCVRVGMFRHGASSFTRDACQHCLRSASPSRAPHRAHVQSAGRKHGSTLLKACLGR